jgi:hypothetical protein
MNIGIFETVPEFSLLTDATEREHFQSHGLSYRYHVQCKGSKMETKSWLPYWLLFRIQNVAYLSVKHGIPEMKNDFHPLSDLIPRM